MAFYLIQASYTAQAVAAMVKNPQDRAAVVRPMIERLGGKLHGLWFAFGAHDIVAIAEMPDNVGAAAVAMAIGSSGAMSAYQSTPLMTSADAVEAMKQAAAIGYQAPK
ncbi:MAG: GYD domain-containing protein [Rubrivivax sp.]|nr:GYD domain-containing protein [Rubrivivax sp.]